MDYPNLHAEVLTHVITGISVSSDYPLTGIFESYRSVLLYGHSPAPWQLLYPTAFSVVLLALVLPVYRREQRQFAKLVEG